MNVGNHERKEVTGFNNFLFLIGKQVFEDNMNRGHIGWSGLGAFVDWLESEYDIIPKDGKDELVNFPKIEKYYDGYMGGILLSNRRPTGAVLNDDNDIVVSFENGDDEVTTRYRKIRRIELQRNVDALNVLIYNTK